MPTEITREHASPGRVARWMWLWIPLALLLTGVGWALSSPVGSAPDDDYHLASIWCAAGEDTESCQIDPADDSVRLVAANVVRASDCYRFDASVNASCAQALTADTRLVPTTHLNQVEGLYPTGFYRVMSLAVSDDVERSVLGMRVLNAVIVSALLALLLRTVPRGIAFATTAALAVTFMPLGLFLLASTSPSSWAVSAILLYWGFALALLHRHEWRSRRTWLIAAGALVSALMAVNSRVDSAAFLVVATTIVVILAGLRRARRNLVSSGVVLGLGVVGLLSYLGFATPGGGGGPTMGTADQGAGLLLTNLVQLPVLIRGVVGDAALGWNDTALPPLVPAVGVLVLGGLAWAGLSTLTARKSWAASIALLALVVIPLWFLQKEGLGVGEVVQPRYLLPLLSLLMATLLLGPGMDSPLRLPRVPVRWAAAGLSVAGVLAFWANAHRYAAGSEVGIFDPGMVPAWTSTTGIPLVATTVAVAVSTTAFMWGSLHPLSAVTAIPCLSAIRRSTQR